MLRVLGKTTHESRFCPHAYHQELDKNANIESVETKTCGFQKVRDVAVNQAWSYFVFTDTVHSTEASKPVREHHLEIIRRTFEEKSQFLKLTDGQYVRRVGDEFKAEFTDPWNAIETVLLIRNRTVALNDGLLERVGLDAGMFVNRKVTHLISEK